MQQEHGLEFLFNDVPLYTKESFQVFKNEDDNYILDEKKLYDFLYYIGCAQNKIVTHCHKCKKDFPFDANYTIYKHGNVCDFGFVIIDEMNKHSFIKFADGQISGSQPPYKTNELKNGIIWYIKYAFECTNNDNHNYIMLISIELNDGCFIVRKVGQNPSMISVKGFDFDKYKKELESINAYEDYKKADLSNADHFYVGAYAYLRRIFEKMVNNYLKKIDGVAEHMDEKIELIKDKFDPRVRDLLKNLYNILSCSIHELDEDDSKEYYTYLKTIVDMQLEYEKTENDKAEQTKKLSSAISKITNGIKNKKNK